MNKEDIKLRSFFGESKVNPKHRGSILINHGDANVQIINPKKGFEGLYKALYFLKCLKANKKDLRVVFVNTNVQQEILTKNAALFCNKYYVNSKWVGGTLTNWKKISKSIKSFNKFEWKWANVLSKNAGFGRIPRLEKLKYSFSGFSYKNDLESGKYQIKKPHVMIVVNGSDNENAIREASLANIPVIGFVETNKSVKGVTYPILSNNLNDEFVNYSLNWFARILKDDKKDQK